MPDQTPESAPTAVSQLAAEAQAALSAVITQAAHQLIESSGLPDFVTAELKTRQYASINDAQAAIRMEQDKAAKYAAQHTVNMPTGGRVEITTPMETAQNAVMWMFGVEGAPLPDPSLRKPADIYTALTGDHDFNGVYRRSAFAGANTTDLPNLAVSAINKVIIQQWAYMPQYRWFEQITAVVPHDGSTHDLNLISYNGPATLPTVTEKGAYTELTVSDSKETAAFVKYGGYVGITLEMFQKSDIARLQEVPVSLANASILARSGAVSAIFTAASGVGPTLADTNPLFHASGSNVATTAFGTDDVAWTAARLEHFNHAPGGIKLGFFPRFCLVPGALYAQALKTFGYGDGSPTAYAPYTEGRGDADPRPVPIVVPNWTDATDWAYVADPKMRKTIVMSYANSMGGGTHALPTVFTASNEATGLMFTNDTLAIKIRDQFAVGVTGRAGIGKRNVAG